MAQIIDLVLVFFIAVVLIMITGFRVTFSAIFFWAYLAIFLVHGVILDAYRQGTIGKLVVGLRVIETPGIRSRFLTSFYRNLLKSFMILFGIGAILLIVGKQGVHNRVTNCIVMEVDTPNGTAGSKVHSHS